MATDNEKERIRINGERWPLNYPKDFTPTLETFMESDRLGYRANIRRTDNVQWYNERIKNVLNSPVSGITSRDQIINPYDYLDLEFYARTGAGKALYEQHLNALTNIQAQQQASFQEYYDSPEQQAIRQRAAGLNPDLNGVENSSSQTAALSEDSPVEGMPTIGEKLSQGVSIAASLASMVVGGVSACAQLAALPAAIAASYASASAATSNSNLLQSQTDAINLANVSSFEKLVYQNASGRLADATAKFVGDAANAGKEFDFDGWFADTKNFEGIYESYAPSENPMYRNAYDRAIKNVQSLKGSAYDIYGNALKGQDSVAQMLSNPYYDENLLLQVSYMKPVMKAREDLRLLMTDYETAYFTLKMKQTEGTDVDASILSINSEIQKRIAENQYFTDYFNGFDGDEKALYELLELKAKAIQENAAAEIEQNLKAIYDKDPSSFMGMRAASMITGGAALNWSDYLGYLYFDTSSALPGAPASGERSFLNLGINALGGRFGALNFGNLNNNTGYRGTDGRFIPSDGGVLE